MHYAWIQDPAKFEMALKSTLAMWCPGWRAQSLDDVGAEWTGAAALWSSISLDIVVQLSAVYGLDVGKYPPSLQ